MTTVETESDDDAETVTVSRSTLARLYGTATVVLASDNVAKFPADEAALSEASEALGYEVIDE